MKKTIRQIIGLVAGIIMLLTVNAHADSKWSGVVDDDWNNAGNWVSVAGANGWIVESTDSAFSQWPVIGNSVVNLSGTALRIASTTGGSAYLGELTIDSGTLISQTVMVMSNGNTNLSTLTVKNGGLINVTGGRIIIGNGANATLNITENSKVVVEMSGTTIIGSTGASSNGTINLGDTGYLSTGTILSVGGFGGSTGVGKIVLTNSGSMQTNGDFRLGDQGQGTLSVNDSAKVTAKTITLGFNGAAAEGTIELNSGVIQADGITVGAGKGVLNAKGGILRATGNNINYLNKVNVRVMTGGLKVDTDGHDVTLTNSLAGIDADGGLTKIGAGTLTLTGGGDYTGRTTVEGGTLLINSGLTGNGAVTLEDGTLSVGNALALNFGALELTGNAALEMGAGSFLTFADSSAETWSGALTLSYEDAQLISFTTNRGLLQSQWELINIAGYEVIGLSNSGLLQLQAVPEPSAWLLLVSGAALLLTLRRRA